MAIVVAEDPQSSRSVTGASVHRLVLVCALVPYALVALGLRLLMARAFFVEGQAKIDGPRIPLDLGIVDFSLVLPAEIKASAFQLFQTQYAGLPLPSTAAAYLFTYAEFVLPILLVVGFATRFAALFLLVLTVLLAVYVAPAAFWSLHVYWIAILVVLISAGPGAISLDRVMHRLYEK